MEFCEAKEALLNEARNAARRQSRAKAKGAKIALPKPGEHISARAEVDAAVRRVYRGRAMYEQAKSDLVEANLRFVVSYACLVES